MDLNKFLQKSKQEDLNQCVIEKCADSKCKNEKNLIDVVLDCQTQRLGPKMSSHRCNVACSDSLNVKADWTLIKLYKDEEHHKFVQNFFLQNEEDFTKVNECIIKKSNILKNAKNVQDVKKKLPMFQQKKGQNIIQKCLKQEMSQKYDKQHIKHATCMYKCYYFNNMINNLPIPPPFKVPRPNGDIFIENQILKFQK